MHREEDFWHPYHEIGREAIRVYLGGPINNCAYAGATSWRDDFAARLKAYGHEPVDPMPRSTGAYSRAQGNLDAAARAEGIAPVSIPDTCQELIEQCDVVLFNLQGLKQIPGGTYGTPFEHALAWMLQYDELNLPCKRILIVSDHHSVWYERSHEQLPTLDEALESIVSGPTQSWWLQRQATLRAHKEAVMHQSELIHLFQQAAKGMSA